MTCVRACVIGCDGGKREGKDRACPLRRGCAEMGGHQSQRNARTAACCSPRSLASNASDPTLVLTFPEQNKIPPGQTRHHNTRTTCDACSESCGTAAASAAGGASNRTRCREERPVRPPSQSRTAPARAAGTRFRGARVRAMQQEPLGPESAAAAAAAVSGGDNQAYPPSAKQHQPPPPFPTHKYTQNKGRVQPRPAASRRTTAPAMRTSAGV